MRVDAQRLEAYLKDCRQRTEATLDRLLPAAHVSPQDLHEAMRYAVLGGGKRVRPALVYAAGEALGADRQVLDAPACAVELIHSYSLVHDDLPAMDDDDLRRGRPTCHKRFGEAGAILAGDALQSLAFQVLAQAQALSAETRAAMLAILAQAAGSRGMAGGQAMDLAAEGRTLTLPELENLHIHKTGALIRASVRLGALAAGPLEPGLDRRLDHYGKCIGLAFQIQDDVLDEEGDTQTLGKQRGADRARAKQTYPSLLGLADAKRSAASLVDEALASLETLDERADPLRWLAAYIVARRH